MITEDQLENILKKHLQKDLEFELNGRIYKRGHFGLFRIETLNNNYELTFLFEKPNTDKVEKFKVPYPFRCEHYEEDGHIFFDYRLLTLTNNNKKLAHKLEQLANESYSPSKYFNRILKIHCNVPK